MAIFNATTNVLLIINEKHKTFNLRCEKDPHGKDSLVGWALSAKRQVKKGYDMAGRHTANTYLAKYYLDCEQHILMENITLSKSEKKNTLKMLREIYKGLGYRDFACAEVREMMESGRIDTPLAKIKLKKS